ncbi:MAG: EthD family reductase [Actinomycetota bacterium]|nr:EthD family reductase [Actinomycetota bacterium]
MIRVTAFYENRPGSRFDMAYYCDRHTPMVLRLLGEACRGATIDEGIGSAEPGAPARYVAMAHFLFDSIESFQAAFGASAETIFADIPNYTDIQPVLQVSNVRI